MSKSVQLLLTENVETLGIIGDVVNVRIGYARNYLIPRGMVTEPSEEKIKALAVRRAEAEQHLAEQRKLREKLTERLEGVEITMERACNDLGMLYGSVTQQDIASALVAAGYGVKPRDVRLGQTIKRVDNYDISVKLASDLEASIKLHVKSDRPLEQARAEAHAAQLAADEIAAKKKGEKGAKDEGEAEAAPEAEAHAEKHAKGDKPEKAKAARPAKKAKAEA